MIYTEILWIIASYFIGAIPFGLVIAKTFRGIDPRKSGSGNIGSTNIARLCGLPFGILTLACDVGKGLFPVWGGVVFFPGETFAISLIGLACVLGHVFSCFLGFRGGKAVATSIGVFIPLAFWPLLGACAVCVFVIWRTTFVSVGSLTLVGSLPVFLAFAAKWQWIPLALCVCVIVFVKHKENIKRLRLGTENPWIPPKKNGNANEQK